MKNLWIFFDKLINTKRIFAFTIGVVAISLLFLQTQDAENLSIIPISRKIIFNFNVFLLAFLSFIFLIESFFILSSGKIEQIRKVVAYFLTIINKIISFLFKYLYIAPFSYLLRPIVEHINEGAKTYSGGIEFLFETQGLAQRADDHYYDKIVDVKELNILIKPVGSNPYWRFGLKFSTTDNFPTARFDETHILFHLTKESQKNELEYNLYQSNNIQRDVLLKNYSNQECKLIIKTSSNTTKIVVFDSNNNILKEVTIPKQKHAQIFAWADGNFPYKIKSIIQERKW